MKIKRHVAFLIFICFIIVISCGKKGAVPEPDNLIEKTVFAEIMVEMILIESYRKKFIKDIDSIEVNIRGFYLELFQEYNTTKENYDASFDYYNANPKRMKAIMDLSDKKLKLLEDRVRAEAKETQEEIIKDNKKKNSQRLPGKIGIQD